MASEAAIDERIGAPCPAAPDLPPACAAGGGLVVAVFAFTPLLVCSVPCVRSRTGASSSRMRFWLYWFTVRLDLVVSVTLRGVTRPCGGAWPGVAPTLAQMVMVAHREHSIARPPVCPPIFNRQDQGVKAAPWCVGGV